VKKYKHYNSKHSQNAQALRQAKMTKTILLSVCISLLVSCGKPSVDDRPIRPSEVLDFDTLFAQRCSGCHGNEGTGSASIALHDPAFMHIVGKVTIRDLIVNGRKNTLMPSFQSNTGNPLSDAQIDALVIGMSENWAEDIPPWAEGRRYEIQKGDAGRGRGAFADFCASCHGPDGTGAVAGSVVNPSYLRLVSEQYLRSVILFGRPELGMPNFAGKTDDETIDDIVAWLLTHKENWSNAND
jgi:mono/diheme cytochrome c family protein